LDRGKYVLTNVFTVDWEATDDFEPEDTDLKRDFEKNQFLDLRKPLLRQVWEANFSKSYYLQQVHQPRHTGAESPRLFGNFLEVCTYVPCAYCSPDMLQVFTRTKWFVVPIVWTPIAIYLALRSIVQFSGVYLPPVTVDPRLPLSVLMSPRYDAIAKMTGSFMLGNFFWTLIEYGMHRFLFHIDELLPDRPFFLMLHFLLHGIHHYVPMDR
jgi:4-hydroxysphinganine ceramide fatty acyl 2-hydroxylase